MTYKLVHVKQTFYMRIGERIRLLREKKNYTGIQLATRAGINQSYLSKLERGNAGFSEEGLGKIAKALGTDVAGLFGDASVVPVSLPTGTKVPILDFTQAVQSIDADTVLSPVGFTLVDAANVDELYALEIRDTSNFPDFEVGDLIIIRRGLKPRPGDFVIAAYGETEAIFRRYRELKRSESGDIVFALVPANGDFPTLNSDEIPIAIRGVMIEHRSYRKP